MASVKSVTELFAEKGILVNPKVNKDVFAGICRVKEYLKQGNGVPDLYIFDNCKAMIEEFSSYFWADGDSPVKRDDHCMDELRYFVMSRPQPAKREEGFNAVYTDKMRRIRRLQSGSKRKR